jgi:hypothetical protein
VALTAAAATTLSAGDVKQVVRVHVTGGPPIESGVAGAEWGSLNKQLEQASDAAEEAAKQLEKELKAQHGKNRAQWPPERLAEMEKAEAASGDAKTKALYPAVRQEDIDGTLWDMTKELDKKERLVLVSNPDEADLIVRILGRRSPRALKLAALLEIAPGPRLDKAALASQKISWPWLSSGARGVPSVNVLRAYRPDQPFWRVEVSGDGAAKKFAGHWGAVWLDKFAEMNTKAFDAARAPAP